MVATAANFPRLAIFSDIKEKSLDRRPNQPVRGAEPNLRGKQLEMDMWLTKSASQGALREIEGKGKKK